MGRLRQKGKAGAAKAYVTRSAAIKKLQCSLADFRRLCILKGIFPREPKSRKRANKGPSAPTTFYYTKDIAYLAHEPVLKKLREHKAFAKKLSRALGRGEWSSAKSLEENKPLSRKDILLSSTFIDALRDIDDALCMIFLFASLPSNPRIPPSLIENCSRLAAEWQLYIMRTQSLRKVFFSIKSVYYQAEVMDQTITWLVPYQFTQNIPADVDVRVMSTFLELYQTLLGFVFFKLYTDAGLVYPPPLDAKRDENAAGVGAYTLQQASDKTDKPAVPKSKSWKLKDVRCRERMSSKLSKNGFNVDDIDVDSPVVENDACDADEEFVVHPSKSEPEAASSLPTLQSLESLPQTINTSLFAPYTFWLSRETSRPIFEFLIRSFGGRIGWPEPSGGGSPFDESDESITHVIIDRPAPYAQGEILPPHLSPFGEFESAYDPAALANEDAAEEEESEIEDEDAEIEDAEPQTATAGALEAAVSAGVEDSATLRAAELAAEAAGIDPSAFEKEVTKSQRKSKKKSFNGVDEAEAHMNKMLMSNKQKKLYEKVKHSQNKRVLERSKLEEKKKSLQKQKRKQGQTIL
ncbi:Pescadillo N-terminus-domain-containing protein [Lentinula raphanica]|nr:Pescadillo N-terminus-domain-containing protein [Lentinula raphanica]